MTNKPNTTERKQSAPGFEPILINKPKPDYPKIVADLKAEADDAYDAGWSQGLEVGRLRGFEHGKAYQRGYYDGQADAHGITRIGEVIHEIHQEDVGDDDDADVCDACKAAGKAAS